MRAGLSTIQQTLTPEAATVLNQSIAEAGRRNHGQTTPLHVAATLLAAQSGYLRQACIRSHPNSSHPLQCRALDLCFSVALDRLPSAQNVSPSLEPPISNALMAALKRAQAHQRRGCPEQQQQPLLAVKVELEQLIVSILDDPSVSRVMREASFSSPAVKATIEQALNSSSNSSNSIGSSPIGACGIAGFRPASAAAPTASRNLYMNPRLQQQQQLQGNQESHQTGQVQRRDDVKRVAEILLRSKKRNPVLVGETEPVLVLRELIQKIEKREMGEGVLKNVRVISLEKELGSDKNQIAASSKIKDLGDLIDNQIAGLSGVIVDLGDLKWLVEQPQGFGGLGGAPEAARGAVAEMGKVLGRFGEGRGKVWLIGTATCETYLRCQVYHPSMEGEWDLQAVPIAAKAPPFQGLFPRIGGNNGILSSSVESLSPLKGFPATATTLSSRRPNDNSDPARRTKCCPLCTQSYERELAKTLANEFEKSSPDAKTEATKQPLPQWLQSAKLSSNGIVNKTTDQIQTNDKESIRKQKTEELQKKWNDTCSRMHPSFHRNASSEIITPAALSMTSMYNSNALSRQTFEPKLQLNRTLGGTLQLSQNPLLNPSPERRTSPLGSPVRTELVLGCTKSSENSPEKGHKEKLNKDLSGCIALESIERAPALQKEKVASTLDPDSFKTLFKGLLEKVWWQNEAASAVAATVIQCRSGNSKRKCFGWKSDTWMLFAGPDRVGKKKMAIALAELLCRSNPITIRLGSRSKDNEESDVNFRGKTTLDRIAEAVQRNPSAVVMLEDIDQADMLVHGSIKRAMERGRLLDSHGREVSIKNVIFILTSSWLPENLKDSSAECLPRDEEKLANLASREWQLQLSIAAKPRKRRLDWLHEDIRPTKSRTDTVSSTGLSFDLNETAENEDDETAEGSRNSSDLTVEHDQEHVLVNKCLQSPATSPVVSELFKCVDDAIVFKPVDFGPLRTKVSGAISSKFSAIVDSKRSIEVDKEAVERIVGGIWFGQTELEEWIEKVLVTSFKNVKNSLTSSSTSGGGGVIEEDPTVFRLVSVGDSSKRSSSWEWLPSKVTVNTQGS
ncbi:hypothetical protein Syun_024981 [Stephania yunnanensis]|uniref:Clp R domain-containing protein n=1 Tax=Stephania yunnanensis TaxID=152371 RepID=A0AAP0HVD0_9MAGN